MHEHITPNEKDKSHGRNIIHRMVIVMNFCKTHFAKEIVRKKIEKALHKKTNRCALIVERVLAWSKF